MNQVINIDVYGKAENQICAGCEHSCGECKPGTKRRTIELVDEFRALLAASDLGGRYSVTFYESTPQNIARNYDVQNLLSMASPEPVVCLDGKVTYLGGFSPEDLFSQFCNKQ